MRKSSLRTRALVGLAAIAVSLTGATCVAFATTAAASAGCQPGSGPNLAGQHLSDSQLSGFQPGHLRCANLTGADLAGLSLVQVDLTGATLRNADLQHCDLGQATLTGADLTGANLTDADLTQAEAQHAKLIGANLTGASFIQADLTGADLSKADLSGTSFDQATLTGTNFAHATGVPPWYLFIGIAAVLFFILLALLSLRRIGSRIRSGRNPAVILACGLLGSLIVAIGFNLTVGGFIGEILSAAGPPVSQTCSAGVVCTIGVASGFIGLFGGVVLMIGGFILRSARKGTSAAPAAAWSGQF